MDDVSDDGCSDSQLFNSLIGQQTLIKTKFNLMCSGYK